MKEQLFEELQQDPQIRRLCYLGEPAPEPRSVTSKDVYADLIFNMKTAGIIDPQEANELTKEWLGYDPQAGSERRKRLLEMCGHDIYVRRKLFTPGA
jgi:hypothetical protein